MLIIDFCRFGNIKSYLTEHRDKFVNQLNELGNLLSENLFFLVFKGEGKLLLSRLVANFAISFCQWTWQMVGLSFS